MIAFDAVSNGSILPGGSFSYTHTMGAVSNGILTTWITSNNLDVITAVSFNGVSMSLARKSVFTGPTMYCFTLVNPTAGAHLVAITASASTEFLRSVSVSYSGAQQSAQPDQSAENNNVASATISTTLTQSVNSAWQVGMVQSSGGSVTASTGIGSIRSDPFAGILVVGDSNTKTSKGTESMTWNMVSGNNAAMQISLIDINQLLPGFFALL